MIFYSTRSREHTASSTEAVLKGIRADVDAFVQGAAQFDDLTMLCMTYRGYGDQAEDA